MTIVVIARNSLAPDEIPSTNGPAIGLRKNVWIRKPERANAPPRSEARAMRGSLIFQMMLYAAGSVWLPPKIISMTSLAGIFTLPIWALSIMEAASSTRNSENTMQ